jgi:hypothetical protein
MQRFDLFSTVHKAVRLTLFDALVAVGRADFGGAADLCPAFSSVRKALRLSREHARHEDDEILPILHGLAPELAADLEAGHDKHDGLGAEIEAALSRIESAPPAERVSLGRRVHEMLATLVAEHLRHMSLEETRANRVLWAHFSDGELLAVQQRIVNAIEPAERSMWIGLMLAACNQSERDGLLALSGAVA